MVYHLHKYQCNQCEDAAGRPTCEILSPNVDDDMKECSACSTRFDPATSESV